VAAEALIREAAAKGADYIQTPEQTALMELRTAELFEKIESEQESRALKRFRALADELGVWLHIGSIGVRVAEDKAANRAFVIAPDGTIAARYDKIHMFDVDLPSGETYRESQNYRPGTRAVAVDLPWGRLGLSVCYDLRFAQLYRALAQAGSIFLSVPAAFTKITGEAHWHVLVRARAIETGCFMLAAAQGGHHENGRDTFGHSMIVSPWGEVLAEAGTEPAVILADIDPGLVGQARGRIAALTHDRPFEVVVETPARSEAAQ
jgi:predicted amidohydrolase